MDGWMVGWLAVCMIRYTPLIESWFWVEDTLRSLEVIHIITEFCRDSAFDMRENGIYSYGAIARIE